MAKFIQNFLSGCVVLRGLQLPSFRELWGIAIHKGCLLFNTLAPVAENPNICSRGWKKTSRSIASSGALILGDKHIGFCLGSIGFANTQLWILVVPCSVFHACVGFSAGFYVPLRLPASVRAATPPLPMLIVSFEFAPLSPKSPVRLCGRADCDNGGISQKLSPPLLLSWVEMAPQSLLLSGGFLLYQCWAQCACGARLPEFNRQGHLHERNAIYIGVLPPITVTVSCFACPLSSPSDCQWGAVFVGPDVSWAARVGGNLSACCVLPFVMLTIPNVCAGPRITGLATSSFVTHITPTHQRTRLSFKQQN